MASGTAPPSDVVPAQVAARPASPSEALIESRLRMTRRRVRTVDIAYRLTTLTAAILAYLFAVAMVDHWVVTGGLGFWGRFLAWALMMTAGWYYFVRLVVPLVVFPINPVFAAHAIEQGWPSFKNSLINFLFLRRQRETLVNDDLARRVYQGLEFQAAAGLKHVSAETAVDRSHLVRVSCVLAGTVAICCLYLAICPKSLLASFGRVLWPWASIPAPTWVTIEAVEPGDAVAYQGDTILVSAEVHRLRGNDAVHLVYSSADGRSVDQAVPMSVPPRGYRYQAELPPGQSGLQQDVVYWLTAGDCTTERFRIEVRTPLTIGVDRVEYKYPAYTGLPPRTVMREGDLRAIEGTEVALHATANREIASAFVDLEGDIRHSVRMDTNGIAATGRFTLNLKPEDPKQPEAGRRPEFTSYQLRFTDAKERTNRRPVRHGIEVDADQRPKVRFVAPAENEVPLLATDSLELKVAAEDDFGLRRVVVKAEVAGKPLEGITPLLEVPASQKAQQGPVEKSYPFRPSQWKLKGGDRVIYWAEADDNKEASDKPAYQKTETEKRTIVIVAPEPQQPPREGGQGNDNRQGAGAKPGTSPDQNPQPGDSETQPPAGPGEGPKPPEGAKTESPPPTAGEQPKQPGQEPGASQPGKEGQDGAGGAGQRESSTPDGAQPGAPKPGSQADKPEEPINGQTNPGEAVDKILEYRDQQEKPPENKTQSGPETPKPQPGDAQPKSEQNGEQPKQAPGETQPGETGPQQPAGKQGPGEPKPAAPQQGAEQPKQPGQDAAGGAGGEKPKPQETQDTGPGAKQPSGMSGAEGAKPGSSPAQKGAAGSGGQGESPSPSPKSPSQGTPPKEKTASGGTAEQQPSGQNGPGSKEAPSGQTQGQGPGERQKPGNKPPNGEQTGPGAKPDASPDAAQPGEATKPGVKEGTDSAQAKPAPKEPGQSQVPGSQAEPGTEAKPSGSGGSGAARPGAKDKPPGAPDQTPQPKGVVPKPEQGPAGAGSTAGQAQPTPAPQGANQSPQKEPTQPSPQSLGKKPGLEEPPSPSISDRTSKAKSDSSGDRSAMGGAGGGKNADRSGKSQPGENAPASDGGPTQQQGPGDVGQKGGEESKSDQAAGRSSPKGDGQGTGAPKQPSGKQPPDQAKGKTETPNGPGSKPDAPGAGRAADKGSQESGATGTGNPARGGLPGDARGSQPPQPEQPTRPDDPNLEYARQRTVLALRTLQEELAKEKSPLLERLGWTPADAEKFLRQWEAMMKAAQEQGPRAREAKQEFDKALLSLGLAKRSTRSSSDQTRKDQVQSQDPGRFAPPPEWAELFEAYNKGVGSSKP